MWTAKLEGERGRASREPRERALARSPSSSARRTAGAGGRACDTTNNVRLARATHGMDRRKEGRKKNKAKPLQLPLFCPLARL